MGTEGQAAARKPVDAPAKRDPTPPGEVPQIVEPPEPPPQVQTDTEFTEEEAREVERKHAFKASPPPDGAPS